MSCGCFIFAEPGPPYLIVTVICGVGQLLDVKMRIILYYKEASCHATSFGYKSKLVEGPKKVGQPEDNAEII